MLKKAILAMAAIGMAATLAACTDAAVVSSNISKAADNFEINRRVVFYNGITGEYMLTIEGLCSLGSGKGEGSQSVSGSLTVTCKTGPNDYKKHYLGLSHNVTYFAEQIESAKASKYHYRVTFKPSVIIPSVDVR